MSWNGPPPLAARGGSGSGRGMPNYGPQKGNQSQQSQQSYQPPSGYGNNPNYSQPPNPPFPASRPPLTPQQSRGSFSAERPPLMPPTQFGSGGGGGSATDYIQPQQQYGGYAQPLAQDSGYGNFNAGYGGSYNQPRQADYNNLSGGYGGFGGPMMSGSGTNTPGSTFSNMSSGSMPGISGGAGGPGRGFNDFSNSGPAAGVATSFGSQFQNFQSSAATQLGMQFGAQALQQGEEMVKQNINKYVNMSHLKTYFNVSNSYVLNKIKLLLFPFRQKTWTRLVKRSERDGQMEGYKAPREDVNAPDLYVPSMAFVTYVLTVGALYGAMEKFTPDALGLTSTTAFFVTVCEILFVKFGCYLLNVASEVPFLDLISYCGYKFIPLVLILALKLLVLNSWIVYSIFCYTAISYGFFTLRTLKYLVLPESTSTVISPQRQRRIYFLFMLVGLQVLTSFFLVYTSPTPLTVRVLPKADASALTPPPK